MDTESGTSARKFFQKPLFWLLLCAALSFVLLAYPIYVIRPFRYQGPRELMVALSVMRIRPALQILLVAAAAGLAVLSWKQMRGVWLRVVSCLCALLVCFFALLSRVNIYELMFHPVDSPKFSPAARSKLDSHEQVISVRIGRETRAYPIRSLSYHHIVNDVLGGLPIVATY
jgi:thiol:disulfide interchange protein